MDLSHSDIVLAQQTTLVCKQLTLSLPGELQAVLTQTLTPTPAHHTLYSVDSQGTAFTLMGGGAELLLLSGRSFKNLFTVWK